MNVVRLRLRLTDFIDTVIEDWVIDKINEIYKINQFKLHLWYDEDDLTSIQLKNFIENHEKKLHFRTTIKPTSDLDRDEFIWFDIAPDDMNHTERSRFTYKGDIVSGLNQFKQTLAFCLKPKNNDTPIRKQKRND